MAVALDDLDQKILDLLLRDGRTPASQLADQVGLSRPAVAERIEKLERAGVIRGTTVVLDPNSLGRAVIAFVAARGPKLDAKAMKHFRELMERDDVLEVHTVAGDDCYSRQGAHRLDPVAQQDLERALVRAAFVRDAHHDRDPDALRESRRHRPSGGGAMKHEKALAYIAFLIVCVVWGTTYLAIRIAVETVPPLLMMATRYIAAGLILFVASRIRREPLPRDKRTLGNLALIGVLMVGVGNLSVAIAEQWVPSGMVALFVATAPFWATLIAALSGTGERIGPAA